MPWDAEVNSLSSLQLSWIRNQIQADRVEEFEEKISMLEYLASFINPRAVQQLKEAKSKTKKVSDPDLIKVLSSLSGQNSESVQRSIDAIKSKK